MCFTRQARSRPATPTGASNGEIPVTNVRVVCRIRPMNDREKKAGATPAATASTERKEVAVVRILAGGTRQVRSTFHFDDVLTSFSSQEDVFRATLQPLVGQVLAGYETTAFAYGQYTYPCHACFQGQIPAHPEFTESTVTVSYLEIYNEADRTRALELSDLLAGSERHPKLDLKDRMIVTY
ncbi:KIN5A [Symbiodinium natans]|uniref:KIN5A protein n=1 Tax=Symbiodinium natans TaxID=878477 RepID=A0A812Q6Y4_9DINO|nr:KIN5A [Symbiodinium natans]